MCIRRQARRASAHGILAKDIVPFPCRKTYDPHHLRWLPFSHTAVYSPEEDFLSKSNIAMPWKSLFVFALLSCTLVLFGGVRPASTIERIHEAFGMSLGMEFSPTEDPSSYTTLDGEPAYFFTPVSSPQSFDYYMVQITPATHQIHTIIAVGKSGDVQTCHKVRAAMMGPLMETYGPSTYLGPVRGSGFEIDYEVILQPDTRRGVAIVCGGIAPIILQMLYVDNALAQLADQERLRLESATPPRRAL